MENKKSKGKIIALICSLVVVVGLATTGFVLAATGALSGLLGSKDKDKAFDLLAQAPEKLVQSAVSEQLGVKELYGAMLEKGMDINYKMTDINLQDGAVNLSGMSMDMGLQLDLNKKKIGGKIGVGKNGSNLSAEGYASLDEKKAVFSLPELIPDKAFSFSANDTESQEAINGISAILAVLPDLQESFEDFVEDQGDALYESAECTKIDNGYRMTLTKAAMDETLNRFRDYVNGQTETFGMVEEKLGMSKGTISAAVSMMIPQLTSYTGDFTFEVYGNGDRLSGISTSIKAENVDVKIRATFADNEGQKTANAEIEAMQSGISVGKVSYSLEGKKGDLCEDVMKLVASASGSELLSYELKETLDVKNNNALTIHTSVNMEGENVMALDASGSVKNLEKGKCMTLHLDEIRLEQSETLGTSQSMTCGMEYTLAVLDGDLRMAAGEEVPVTPETMQSVLGQYETEAQKNLISVLGKWGLGTPNSTMAGKSIS